MTLLAMTALLAGCGYQDSRDAHRAQLALIGMTAYDLQSCAGIPASTKKLNDTTEIFQYSGTHAAPSWTGSTLIPIADIYTVTNQIAGGGGTGCTAVFRLDHDRVSEVHYLGDDDEVIGTDGLCSLITRGCTRQLEATGSKVKGGLFGPVSAFHAPQTPRQSTSATYSTQSGTVIRNPDPNSTDPVIVPRTK